MQTPSIEILDRPFALQSRQESPLHFQVRQTLRSVIENHFDDGQQFWTESELIEKLGVSRITVRRALDDLTREGILNRQRAKGSFVRKSAPVVPATKPFHIGMLAPNCGSAFIIALLQQISLASTTQKQHFTIHLCDDGQSISEMLCQLERGADDEALLLVGTQYHIAQQLYDTLRERSYRIVCVDSPAINAPFVGVDNEAGIRMGMEHLRELGHRRIAYFVNEPSPHPNVIERVRTFERLGQNWGLEIQVFYRDTYKGQLGIDATQKALETITQWNPTAIFTASDSGAWSALKWLREHNVKVPEQVSVLGFDDEPPSAHTFPTLSSVVIPADLVAKAAIDLLSTPDLHTTSWPHRELIKPRLMVRESTSIAPTSSTLPKEL